MYSTILLPIDLNDEGSWHKALPAAVRLAEAFGARIHVMTVIPDFGMSIVGSFFPSGYEDHAKAEAVRHLDAFVAERVPPHLLGGREVAQGSIYHEILHAAAARGADLIVMGAHRPDLADYLLGPNAARVVRHSRRSVLVVRD